MENRARLVQADSKSIVIQIIIIFTMIASGKASQNTQYVLTKLVSTPVSQELESEAQWPQETGRLDTQPALDIALLSHDFLVIA